jgi:hypothetical protein
MNRKIRVKIELVIELQDEGEGLPSISSTNEILADVATRIAPGPASLEPGGKISVGFTRASSAEIRRLQRTRSLTEPTT